jgi:hypothetical protein
MAVIFKTVTLCHTPDIFCPSFFNILTDGAFLMKLHKSLNAMMRNLCKIRKW